MKPIDPEGFETLFRRDTDPWNYARSPFEAFKRRALLRACGVRRFGRGLEIACANGETSRSLASRCLNLLAVDASPTVVEAARRRVQASGLRFEVARLPQQTPRGPFDLIVASEILYYLTAPDMAAVLDQLVAALAPGGRLVLLHHTVDFDDAAQSPRRAQDTAMARLDGPLDRVLVRRYARFQVAAFQRPRAGVGRSIRKARH